MDYKITMEAGLDQLDAMLRDNALIIHEVALKPPAEWSYEDYKIVLFSLHATAARANYLRGEIDEESD